MIPPHKEWVSEIWVGPDGHRSLYMANVYTYTPDPVERVAEMIREAFPQWVVHNCLIITRPAPSLASAKQS